MSIVDTAARTPHDPAETWELEYEESRENPYDRGIQEIYPHSPHRAEDIPSGAMKTLDESCRIEGLHQVFLLPRAARPTGREGHRAISPSSVLGIGTRAVGLWTGERERGVKVVIPLDRISAIEDVTILLYSRLSILSSAERLTIRFNTLARSSLRPVLLGLRERLAGPPLSLPQEEEQGRDLPVKWRRLIRTPFVRFREGAPVASRFTIVPRRSRDDVERGQLLVVNPYELVYMCDPLESSHNYGEDSFIVPRSRITRIRAMARYLEVASNGARFSLTMEPALREAAARWLA
jgi:hypothetical protein